MSAGRPVATVVVFPGSNGDRDLFETFERVGFSCRYHPSDRPLSGDSAVVGLPGGFSYGDYWRAGMLASQAPAVADLPRHVEQGGLVIGICNGFQILVEAGLLPGALSYNDPPGFRHRWLTLKVQSACPSPWFAAAAIGDRWRLPMAHGEGNYFHPDGAQAIQGRVPLVYDQNPNGSLADAAALLDATGRVLGVMPHPERASDPDLGSGDGLQLFRAAFAAVRRDAL
ncbi:MAG: phosphoribosylformylglycinamidine synthase I [Deltaproteobacteria bacterium]|nr:phosphoribosylformylglycinamidine synthase I [Deltaproteobacteria bacterium]